MKYIFDQIFYQILFDKIASPYHSLACILVVQSILLERKAGLALSQPEQDMEFRYILSLDSALTSLLVCKMQDTCCSGSGTACCIWVELNASLCFKVCLSRKTNRNSSPLSISFWWKKSSSFIDIPINTKEVKLEKSSSYASHSTTQKGLVFLTGGTKIPCMLFVWCIPLLETVWWRCQARNIFKYVNQLQAFPTVTKTSKKYSNFNTSLCILAWRAARGKNRRSGSFTISKMNLRVLRVPSLSSVQSTFK